MKPIQLSNLKDRTLAKGIRAKVVTGENLTVTHVQLDKDAVLPEHRHINEQIVNVISGDLELTVEGVPHLLKPGTSFILPSNVPHSATAKSDVYVIDVFYPVREDLKQD